MRQSVRDICAGGVAVPGFDPGGPVRHFQQSEQITVAGIQAGWLMWGGPTQKGRAVVELSGKGCELVPDWSRAEDALLQLRGGRFTRGDIAADFYRGEVTHERIVQAHKAEKFRRGQHGRPPSLETVVSTDADKGRTCYVGRRGGDTMLRGYEKGKKEFAGWSLSLKKIAAHPEDWTTSVRGIDGMRRNGGEDFNMAEWYRVEVELRSDKREMPNDWITRRDEYFAGCYPFTAELLPEVEGRILVTPKRFGILNVERALEVIKNQWGRALYTALAVYGGDMCGVWDKIVGAEHSPRLVGAGALLAIDPDMRDARQRIGARLGALH
jgi:phage replication initiation protein